METTQKTTRDPIAIMDQLWEQGTKEQKENLLEALGLHKSFAETKTIYEMVKRGGGLAASDILKLVRKYLKENKDTSLIMAGN